MSVTVESVRSFWHEYRRSKIGLAGLFLLGVLVLVAVTFPVIGDSEVIKYWYGDLTYFQDYPRAVPPCWAAGLLSDKEPTSTIVVRSDTDPQKLASMLYLEEVERGELEGYAIVAVFPIDGDELPADLYMSMNLGYEVEEPPVAVDEIRIEKPDGSALVVKPRTIIIKLGALTQRYTVSEIYFEGPDGRVDLVTVKAGEVEPKGPLARVLQIEEKPASISEVFLGYPEKKLEGAVINVNLRSMAQSIATKTINSLQALKLIQRQFKLELVEVDDRVLDAGIARLATSLYNSIFTSNIDAAFNPEGGSLNILKGDYKLTIILAGSGLKVEMEPLKVVVKGSCYGLMGTDANGRDLWQALLYGTRWALIVGLLTSAITVVVGSFYGVVAGYAGGIVDEVLLRIAQIVYSLPVLPFLILLSALIKPSIWIIIILIVLFSWPGISFVTRSMALQIKSEPYVEAAIASGAGTLRILVLYVFPQVLPYMFASMALSVPSAVIAEASLSFLNLGDPNLVTWGKLLYDAQNAQAALKGYWWWVIPPGLGIAVVGMTFIFIGNALDAILNPKLKR